MEEIFDWLREQMEWNQIIEMHFDGTPPKQYVERERWVDVITEAEAKWKEKEAELRANVIDEFAERLKMASIRGTFEHKPDKEKPWYKVRSYCKVVGTRKIDEIASQMKGEKE